MRNLKRDKKPPDPARELENVDITGTGAVGLEPTTVRLEDSNSGNETPSP